MKEPQDPAACLVLCCKAPRQSKRRLAAGLGNRTVEAAGHLLACALEDLADWPGETVIAPASNDDADWLRAGPAGRLETVVQCGGSLGERINFVDGTLRARGRQRLIYIGADCPALSPEYLSRADRALDDCDAVLGPAADGGVVLMGAREPWPALGDLAWSTSDLLDGLRARLREEGWSLAILETLTDVDTVDDLRVVADTLIGERRRARRALVDWLSSDDLRGDATS